MSTFNFDVSCIFFGEMSFIIHHTTQASNDVPLNVNVLAWEMRGLQKAIVHHWMTLDIFLAFRRGTARAISDDCFVNIPRNLSDILLVSLSICEANWNICQMNNIVLTSWSHGSASGGWMGHLFLDIPKNTVVLGLCFSPRACDQFSFSPGRDILHQSHLFMTYQDQQYCHE